MTMASQMSKGTLTVGGEVSSDLTLLEYIRTWAELRGTKYMCREGGCGACIVSAVKTPNSTPLAVNSCLVSVTSCQNWDITTVEKVGNKLDGYHILQTTLAKYNGTQCGHCTPGWIMAMYSLLKSQRKLTMLDMEQSFGSNVCRCTGYRPILEAFKKFATDSADPIIIPDMEDLHICKRNCQTKCKRNCIKDDDDDWYLVSNDDVQYNDRIAFNLKDGKKWYRVYTVQDIFSILQAEGIDSYMLIAGNTAKGAYPIDEYPRVLIDISAVSELKGYLLDQNLVIGSGTTLTELLDLFQNMSKEEYFWYLQKFYDHLQLVAHIPVRNLGTIAGNLMIKYQHNEFPSDVFLLLETVGAQLTIQSFRGSQQVVTMEQFLTLDLRGKIIRNVMLPPLSRKYKMVTFKIMPKTQNAHAIVNAGFLFKLNENNQVLESRIAYGGLSPTFVRATATEIWLLRRQLFNNETLQTSIRMLKSELVVTEKPPEPSVLYRKQLAVNLFYKGLLTLCPLGVLSPRYCSATTKIHETRPVSKASQIYTTDSKLWPLNQSVQKLEALTQCSGEAPFTEDIPSLPREVFAAFVLSTVPVGNIASIDSGAALKKDGVIAFYTSKDIPGVNTFITTQSGSPFTGTEEILSSGEIKYFNQPIGIIVAETYPIAVRAAKMVKVTYTNVRKPIIDIKEAKRDNTRNNLFFSSNATKRGSDIATIINGNYTVYGQFHFTMETLVCVSRPTDEGLEVHAATQWLDSVQHKTSLALNMDQNRIDVNVTRLGGAYGLKITRTTQVAVACNLVVSKLNRPCRFILPLTTLTRAVGKRFSCSTDFELGANTSGVIQYLNYNIYEDNGHKVTELLVNLGTKMFNSCYDKSTWNYRCFNSTTDKAKNTWFRSPGSFENMAIVENIMEQISYELSLDPIEVRLRNLGDNYRQNINEIVNTLQKDSQYSERRTAVDRFNTENRWKKRGLRFSLLRFELSEPTYWDCNLSVYHGDGTVAISHGGVEMGQGVNTKAAQICAYLLKIPLDKIKIKRNDTMLNPNSFLSGGSYTSQFVALGVRRCCDELLKRLQPIRNQMGNPSWEELIAKAFESNIDLQTHGFVSPTDTQVYDIYGVALSEVEVDILTGEHEILRVDLLQDVGQSVSPEIDIGQVEGAFVMGTGYWTSEQLVYNPSTGELLTDRSWNYYVPQARDIPQDFRISFRKNSYNNDVTFGAKAVGEPPLCLSISVPLAIREAIAAARLESGYPTKQWFIIDGPCTVENVYLATLTSTKDFKFY